MSAGSLIEYFNKYNVQGLSFRLWFVYTGQRIHELIGGINAFYIEAHAFVPLQNVREFIFTQKTIVNEYTIQIRANKLCARA